MKRRKIRKELDRLPSNLTDYHLIHPSLKMRDFFDDYPIHQTKAYLWQLYQCWVYQTSDYKGKIEAADMLCFFTQSIEFLEACYVEVLRSKAGAESTHILK